MNSSYQNWFKIELLLTHSCIILRKFFKDRWLLYTGKSWKDTPADGQTYITGIGKSIYQSCRNIQKIMLANGNTNEWDLSILIIVLRDTKSDRKISETKKKLIRKQNNDLSKISNIRNSNAHHPSKCISDIEFEDVWHRLSTILVAIGDDADEITELKVNMNYSRQEKPVNNPNTIEAKRLKDLGNEAYRQKNIDEAIKLFSQALILSGLSDVDRSILYSNRAAVYLENPKNNEISTCTDSRYLALQDAEQSRDLRQTWPKAHYRVGQAYFALGEYERAIHSFNKALALDPTNHEIKNAHDSALERKLYYDRQDHLILENAPQTTREQLSKLSKVHGYTLEAAEKIVETIRKIDPGKDAVFTGHQYRDGDDNIKQNYELAARYYAKAVGLGSPEGMYNLALLHERGLGVKKDIQTAIRLFEQAAGQNPTMFDDSSIPNVGVAEAEHSLGLHYQTGVGVEVNYHKAVQWYQRASDHGSATAANNLGLMYGDGEGIDKDLVKSEQLLRLAAIRGDPNAPMNLAFLLFKKFDFQAAAQWCLSACEKNNIIAKEHLKKFQNAAKKERDDFKKSGVEEWEKQNGFSVNNLNYNERIQRRMCANNADVKEAYSTFQDLIQTLQSLKPVSQPTTARSRLYDREILEKYSLNGYTFARQMLKAQTHFFRAMEILLNDTQDTDGKRIRFVEELSASIQLAHFIISMPESLHDDAKHIVDQILVQCNSKQSELDENARVCFAFLHMNSIESTIEFLTVCIRLYPRSIFFLDLRGSLYGFAKKFGLGLTDFNAALQLAPTSVELLYSRAAMSRLNEHINLNDTISAYQNFLECASTDHRKVPEAYYAVASCYMIDTTLKNHLQLAEEYYEKGVQSEQQQLPCFLPYKSNHKQVMSMLFSLKQAKPVDTMPIESLFHSEKPKSRLSDIRRIDMIQSHRQAFATKSKWSPNMVVISHTVKPRHSQNIPASLIGLQGITLREMNPMKDHVYHGYVLSGLIFEEAPVIEPSIWLLFEDDNGDLERLFIYNIPPIEACQLIKDTYVHGTKVSLLNPYMRMAADGKPAIRVDDPSSIILHGDGHNLKQMCRCCSAANARHVCSKCRIAYYCSKACQTMDWKQYDHKYICS